MCVQMHGLMISLPENETRLPLCVWLYITVRIGRASENSFCACHTADWAVTELHIVLSFQMDIPIIPHWPITICLQELIQRVEKLVSSNQTLKRQIRNLKRKTEEKDYKKPNQRPFDFSRYVSSYWSKLHNFLCLHENACWQTFPVYWFQYISVLKRVIQALCCPARSTMFVLLIEISYFI